jgi:hypothetical protein
MQIQEEPHGTYYVLGGDQQSTFNGSYFKRIESEEFLNWQTFVPEEDKESLSRRLNDVMSFVTLHIHMYFMFV